MKMRSKIYKATLLAALISAPAMQLFAQAKTAAAQGVSGDAKLSKLKTTIEANPNDINSLQSYYETFLEVNPGHEKDLVTQIQAWADKFPSAPYFPIYLKRAAKLAARTTDKVALDKLKKAVEATPDSMSRHEAYIEAIGPDNPDLITRYDALMKEFPKNAMVPYALAKMYIDQESPKAKPYLLKTVAINPKYAQAWADLWMDAQRWGHFNEGWEYMKKAIAADPTNPSYQFSYATSFMGLDQKKFIELSFKIAKDFPNSEYAVRALGYMATRSGTAEERIKCYQMIHDNFPKEKGVNYMTSYFDVLIATDPEKAKALASEMKDVKGANTASWTDLSTQAESFIQGKKLLAEHKPAEALAALNKVKLGRYSAFGNESLLLLQADATDQTGDHAAAYAMLMKVFVKDPSPAVQPALYQYGLKAGKNETAVKADIYANLEATAKAATPFTLKKYIGEGSTSLSDYKGKVMLLTYWFPGCGPCRGEMPFFENVVRQYKTKPLEYVGINIVAEQDEYVIPFHNTSGFSFTPLADFKGRDKGNLDNRNAAPVNFIIDQNGRIIFSNFSIHAENESHLKMMIDLVLNSPAKS